jgi:DNA-binding MarR family transcriptional regulator
MDERERVIREIIKVLPELAKSLNRDVAAHAAMMHVGAGSASPGSASPGSASPGSTPGSTPGVSTAQLRALVHLAQYGPQTMGELAEGLQITTASATGLVNPLVEMGHVTRSRDANDRRVVRIGLSERAERLAKDIIAERRREVEVALDGMDLQACRSFLEGLERLAGHTTRRKAEADK